MLATQRRPRMRNLIPQNAVPAGCRRLPGSEALRVDDGAVLAFNCKINAQSPADGLRGLLHAP